MSPDQFDEFFRKETGLLVAFVRRAAGVGQEPARDAVQDAMIKALPVWEKLENPRAWIRRVAYRAALAEATRSRDGVIRAVSGGWSVSTHHDPDVAVLANEHNELLQQLSALPRKQRLVMAWHLDGFDNDEIAEQLDMAPGTVRSNLRHARAAMRTRYQERRSAEGGLQ